MEGALNMAKPATLCDCHPAQHLLLRNRGSHHTDALSREEDLGNIEILVEDGDAFVAECYWRSGHPKPGFDFNECTACVDFSAINSGKLAAYRWDGESEIQQSHYFNLTN